MMPYKRLLLVSIIAFNFVSCGRNKSENDLNLQDNLQEQNDTPAITTSQQKETTYNNDTSNENELQGSVLSESKFTKNQEEIAKSTTDKPKTDAVTDNKTPTTPEINSTKPTTKKNPVPSNYTIQKILNGCEIGETLTQEDLTQHLEIPKDAIKLVKTITKVSEDEIDVKWKSTWAVEKLSDAKFKDGRIKARFINNSVYISGGAIAIKCDKKIYTDFLITGRKATIPSIKGYYWKIGRD
jgi:hypothetical protein